MKKTQAIKIVICLILALGLVTVSAVSMAADNSTAEVASVQKEKMPAPMKAKKKKGCKCRMGMMKEKGKGKAPMGMMGCKGMMGNMLMKRMSKEQREKFLDETVPLRRQMVVRQFDFMEALRSPKTSAEDLAKIEKDMLELRIKMLDKLIGKQP